MFHRGRIRKVLVWFCVVICAIMAIGSIPSVAMVLFAGVTVMALPTKKIDGLWERLLKGKRAWIKTLSLFIVFVLATSIAPISDESQQQPGIGQTETVSEIATENVQETQSTVAGETETQTQSEESGNTSETAATASPQEELLNNNSYISLEAIPAYDGKAYVAINDNVPFFTDSEMVTTPFEYYSELDSLGRCGVTYANVCKEIMPTEERGKIGSVKPSGWHTVKYDIVQGKYLYNRCHLIGYQLSGENANTKNLITGTRYLNIEGMLPFENMVADYVKETGNHVLYRVTPMFSGNNLLANGVLMEAKSVEDNGAGILFNVYCYNVQPGISINYENGDSSLDGSTVQQDSSSGSSASGNSNSTTGSADSSAGGSGSSDTVASSTGSAGGDNSVTAGNDGNEATMVHITNTGSKYHMAGCRYLKDSDSEVTLDDAKSMGLSPCKVCNPPQ